MYLNLNIDRALSQDASSFPINAIANNKIFYSEFLKKIINSNRIRFKKFQNIFCNHISYAVNLH